ncbi:MAG: UDP-N-acetylmuramoyl-L-alanine--D-glutamate ligase, partial [Fimbriimonadales bacterium]
PLPPPSSGAQPSPQEGGGLVPIVAITGTNGKSTTTVMTYLALRECGIDAVLCGNIFGTGLPEVPLTEAALHATPDQVLVAEISSFQLEWVSRFRPAVAGITNITPDHLDRYDSFEQYAATKMRIFAAEGEGDYAVVDRSTAFQPRSDATVLTFGAQGEHAQILEDEIRILNKTIKTEDMHVIGNHNYANAAMAGLIAFATLRWISDFGSRIADLPDGRSQAVSASVALALLNEALQSDIRHPTSDILPEPIITALRAFKGIEHRMEYLGEKGGVKVINNSMCTNPDAVVKSAQAVKGPNHLIMGGKDKDLPFTPVRNYLASGMHRAYLFGEAKEVLNKQLGGGFPTYNTLQEAFRAATDKARPGEVIMLAPGCASTDQFNDFRDRGNVFKKFAKEWLES